ncbi:hypothetical protein TNCV_359651 [Trichonephila clavipes]|nr:hypothetical protein TNCV_359651 [Trichonephila clavipes]
MIIHLVLTEDLQMSKFCWIIRSCVYSDNSSNHTTLIVSELPTKMGKATCPTPPCNPDLAAADFIFVPKDQKNPERNSEYDAGDGTSSPFFTRRGCSRYFSVERNPASTAARR